MKFQSKPFLFMLSSAFMCVSGQSFESPTPPVCVNLETITMKGDAEFVDTDGSGLPSPSSIITTGDMSIGELYMPVSLPIPDQGILTDIDFQFKSICVTTKDQTPPSFSSPTCFYEFELQFCKVDSAGRKFGCREGGFTGHGSGPENLKITGGRDGFFGAFGQIVTPTPFNPGDMSPNGDLIGSSIDMGVNICYYEDKGDGEIDPPLNSIAVNPTETLQLCEGDCDTDADCADDLKCFQRNGLEAVPGCRGTGINDYDYCIYPELNSIAVNPTETLQLCEGDCDSDADCADDLKCFQRNGLAAVPGCSGTGINDYDYCIYPELNSIAVNPTQTLQLCEGDCDSDADCAPGLKCFQRNGLTAVPGCSGRGINDYDYCVLP